MYSVFAHSGKKDAQRLNVLIRSSILLSSSHIILLHYMCSDATKQQIYKLMKDSLYVLFISLMSFLKIQQAVRLFFFCTSQKTVSIDHLIPAQYTCLLPPVGTSTMTIFFKHLLFPRCDWPLHPTHSPPSPVKLLPIWSATVSLVCLFYPVTVPCLFVFSCHCILLSVCCRYRHQPGC